MGILKRPPVREGCAQAPVPSVSHAARPMRVAQAPSAPGGHHRVADGDLRQHEPRIHRRSAVDRLDPGRMRTQPSRPSNARRLARPPVTGIAPRTPDFSGGFGCTQIFAPDGTPRALALASPNRDEREVGLELLGRCRRSGGEMLVGDTGYAGRAFARAVGELDATIVRPRRANESAHHPHLAPIRRADRVHLYRAARTS